MYCTVTFVLRNGREVTGRQEATTADLLATGIDTDRKAALRERASSAYRMTDGNGVVTSVDLTRVDYFRVSPGS